MNAEPLHTLIVEDDRGYSELIKEYLESQLEPFAVAQAYSARQALERLSGAPFDLIILDLHLPDGQGLDVFDRVRLTAPSAAVLIVSGAPDEGDFALKAAERGAQDYLVKGDFDWKTFMRSVRYAVTRKKMEENLKQNVSELKTVEEKLRSANTTLERKVRELDRLIHIMMGREERILQLKIENQSLRGESAHAAEKEN